MYQHIMVESGAKVFQKNNRLCIEKDVFHELPAEDIATVVLDNREIIITTYCLEQLSSRGTVVILCNGKHMPESVLLPYGANSRRLKTIRSNFSKEAAPEAALAASGAGKNTEPGALSGILRQRKYSG